MLLSCLHQPFGVAVGSFDSGPCTFTKRICPLRAPNRHGGFTLMWSVWSLPIVIQRVMSCSYGSVVTEGQCSGFGDQAPRAGKISMSAISPPGCHCRSFWHQVNDWLRAASNARTSSVRKPLNLLSLVGCLLRRSISRTPMAIRSSSSLCLMILLTRASLVLFLRGRMDVARSRQICLELLFYSN